MHIAPFENNLGRSSIEVLKLQLTHFTAIHSIGPFTTELLNIELMRSQTDFLIGIKTDTDFAMLDFGMLFQIYHRRNNLGNAGFIVSTQQGLSVGDNQVFPFVVEQFGKLGRRKDHFPLFAKNNILAIVILHNTRGDILTTHIGACIHVGNEPHDRYRLICIGRKGGEQITVLIQRDLFQAQSLQFFLQIFSKHHLP